VREGIAGGLARVVAKMQRQCGGSAKVLATGGAWKTLEPWADFDFRCVPDLTLVGTALFAGRSADADQGDGRTASGRAGNAGREAREFRSHG
jgi:hypothetical protein